MKPQRIKGDVFYCPDAMCDHGAVYTSTEKYSDGHWHEVITGSYLCPRGCDKGRLRWSDLTDDERYDVQEAEGWEEVDGVMVRP